MSDAKDWVEALRDTNVIPLDGSKTIGIVHGKHFNMLTSKIRFRSVPFLELCNSKAGSRCRGFYFDADRLFHMRMTMTVLGLEDRDIVWYMPEKEGICLAVADIDNDVPFFLILAPCIDFSGKNEVSSKNTEIDKEPC